MLYIQMIMAYLKIQDNIRLTGILAVFIRPELPFSEARNKTDTDYFYGA
jgi:hypothetical protein